MDYYLDSPIPEFDPTVRELDECNIQNIPIIRIFGSTSKGEKVCAHIHGVLPYLFVIAPYMECDDEIEKFGRLLAYSVEKGLNLSSNSKTEKFERVHSVQTVKGLRMYGYSRSENVFYKLFLYDPADLKRVSTLLLEGAILNTVFQPHQVHVPYNLQFLIDFNLRGMDYLKSKRAKQREDANRQSYCQYEVDIKATDILNAEDTSSSGRNPALEYIWKEEGKKEPNLNRTLTFQSKFEYDTDGLQRLNEVVERFRGDASIQSTPDATALEVGDEPIVSRETIERLTYTQQQRAKDGKELLLKKAKSGDAEAFKQLDAQEMFQLEEGDSILLAHNEEEEEEESIDEKDHVQKNNDDEEQDLSCRTIPQLDGVSDMEEKPENNIDKFSSNLASLRLKTSSKSHVILDLRPNKSQLALRSGSKRDDGAICEHVELLEESEDDEKVEIRPKPLMVDLRMPQKIERTGTRLDLRNLCRISPSVTVLTTEKSIITNGKVKDSSPLLESFKRRNRYKIQYGQKKTRKMKRSDRNEIDANIDKNQIVQAVCVSDGEADYFCSKSSDSQETGSLTGPLQAQLLIGDVSFQKSKPSNRFKHSRCLAKKSLYRRRHLENKFRKLKILKRKKVRQMNLANKLIEKSVEEEKNDMEKENDVIENKDTEKKVDEEITYEKILTTMEDNVDRKNVVADVEDVAINSEILYENIETYGDENTSGIADEKGDLINEVDDNKNENEMQEEIKIDTAFETDKPEPSHFDKDSNALQEEKVQFQSSGKDEIPPLVHADMIIESECGSLQMSKKNDIPEIRETLADTTTLKNTDGNETEQYGDKVGNDHTSEYSDVGMKLALLSPAKEEKQTSWSLSPSSPNLINGTQNMFSSPQSIQNTQSCTPSEESLVGNSLMSVSGNEETAEVLNLSTHDKKEVENASYLFPELDFCSDEDVSKQSTYREVSSSRQTPPVDLLKMAVEAANINNNADDEDCIITESHYRGAPIIQHGLPPRNCDVAKAIELQHHQVAAEQERKRRQQQLMAVQHRQQQEQYRMQQLEREKQFQQYQQASHQSIPQQQHYYSSYAGVHQQTYVDHQQSSYDPNANHYRPQPVSYTSQYSHMYPTTCAFNYPPYSSHINTIGQNVSYNTFSDAGHGIYRQHTRYPQS